MLWLVALLEVQSSVAPVPPIIPPPIVAVAPPAPFRIDQTRRVDPIVVDVTVTAGDRVLYQGTLRTGGSSTARFSEDKTELASDPCVGTAGFFNSERSSFSIQLTPFDTFDDHRRVTVSVDWARPVPTGTCGPGTARTVRVSQTVQLEPHRPMIINGDASLSVKLVRR